MKRKLAVFLSVIILLVFCVVPVQAHSGRTDANGGHRDNKNKSGLGYYHYHHGYGPHLHPGGVCPYDNSKQEDISTPVLVPIYTPQPIPAPIVQPPPIIPTINLDGKQLTFDVAPIIEDGRTLVPLRNIFEAMGALVTWDQGTQTATAVKGNNTVVIKIGNTSPTINGQLVQLDVPAKIVNGRTLAPLRFVGEAFGGTVGWDQGSQTITILSKPSSGNPPPALFQMNSTQM